MAAFSSLRWLAKLVLRAGWAPVGVVVLFLWLGAIGRLAEFDHLVHGLGGASMAYVAWVALSMQAGSKIFDKLRPVSAFGIACAVAILWELAEFVADRTLGTSMQHGANETLGDVVSGAVGGGAAAILAFGANRFRSK